MITDHPPLSPYGTVRRDVDQARDPRERFAASLRAGCARLDLGDELLFLADDLAGRSGLDGRDREALLLLLLLSLAAVRRGSTLFPLENAAAEPWVRAQLDALLTPAAGWTTAEALTAMRALARRAPAPLFGPRGAAVPLFFDDGNLYHQRLHHLEASLAARLAALGARSEFDRDHLEAALREVVATAPFALEPEQRYALVAAAAHRLCIITGGPGTGKTTIVVGVMRMLVRLGLSPDRIALAAPTGKAAYRMGTAIRDAFAALPAGGPDAALRTAALDPKTVHRLLGYLPAADKFRHDEHNPIACDALVVDEASMLDLHLMDRLLRALPAGARLILLGDQHQLPSVDSGAVLRDLIAAQAPAYDADLAALAGAGLDPALVRPAVAGPGVVRLVKGHRAQAGTSLDAAARAVNAGDGARLAALAVRRSAGEARFEDLEWIDAARPSNELLRRWFDVRVAAGLAPEQLTRRYAVDDRAALDPLFAAQTARLLCVTRVGANGAASLNARLHALHRRFLNALGDAPFYPGEPVLMLANDYDKQLFNGDQGLVLEIEGLGLAAVFARDGGYVAYPLATLGGAVEHGYALTVHKSQGSEVPHVAVVLPPEPMPLVTREILYTALTRAKRSALVVGPEAVVAHAVAHPEQRFTGLATAG